MERGKSLERKDTLISELLTQEYAFFYRVAYSYVGNEADALDIVQESAYKAIYNSGKLKHPEYAKTWICRIVINEAVTLLRKKKNHADTALFEAETAAAGERLSKEEAADLKEAIKQLSPEERTMIVLRFFEDMKLEEIAEICGESLSTVKSRLYRTLKKLKLNLEVQE